jgi:transmembrane sensor
VNWDLLIKVIRKEATPAELHVFNAWLHLSPGNKNIYEALLARYQTIEQVVTQDVVAEEWARIMPHLSSPVPAGKVGKLSFLRYAAAAAIVIIAGISSWWLLRSPHTPVQLVVIHTTSKEKKKVILPDSSIVWLHYDAALQYDSRTFNHAARHLQLTGEAFFEVAPAADKPFTVQTSHLQVTVLGTSFHIAEGADKQEEVTVATGKVNVHGPHVYTDLLPLQRITYNPAKQSATIGYTTLAAAAAMKNNQLVFYKDNIKTIAAKMEHWYNRKVIVHGIADRQVAFTGTITDNGIHEVLAGLGYQAGFTYRINTDSIFIYPK